jgi:putative endonuclease
MDTDEHGCKLGAKRRQVLGMRQSAAAFQLASRFPKVPEDWRSPRRRRVFPTDSFIRVNPSSSVVKNLIEKIRSRFAGKKKPEHLRRGELGERKAKMFLRRQGLKFLTANFRSERGEIDLIFRDSDCLVFVEVKTRSSEEWARPAAAVNAERRQRLSRAALDYLRLLKNPPVKIRFDIVEVLLAEGKVREVRHLPNTFAMEKPYRYG